MIIPVKTGIGEYNIYLERGALKKADSLINLKRKVLIVTDDGVPEIYADTVAAQCETPFVVTLPQGENSKSLENYKMLLSKMVAEGFTRTDCVVAVGGGVVGDLSGFVAASFMRGVDFYNIPTTLLSQVDSSIGGKVAIDFEGYKNIVGAFYPPKAVIIDSNTLSTLDKRQVANGLAEAVKMALTSDSKLFEIFEVGQIETDIDTIIEKSLRVKKSVVEQDEKEQGIRKILNFGHTLAHAIESQNNLSELYHGECVALGMLPMCSAEVRERLLPVLKKLNLPTRLQLNMETIINAVYHDKKAAGKDITVITVPKIGQWEMKKIPLTDYEGMLREGMRS